MRVLPYYLFWLAALLALVLSAFMAGTAFALDQRFGLPYHWPPKKRAHYSSGAWGAAGVALVVAVALAGIAIVLGALRVRG